MLKRLGSSGLVRNVLAVASGTAAAQVIVFAFSPLITRIYSPEVFGLQGVFLSLISIFSPVIALRYPMAIITAETETEALRLARLSLLIALGMAGLFWLILLAGGQTVLHLLGAEGLGPLILLLPLGLLCVAMQDVTDYHAARLGAFRLVGMVEIAQAFLLNLARVIGGLGAPVAATLVAVTSIGPAFKAAMMWAGTGKRRGPVRNPRRVEATELLRRHRDFPVYRMPTDVMNALAQTSPVLLLSYLYSPSTAGYYVLARSVINLPLNVISSAVANVYYSRFADIRRKNEGIFPIVSRSTALHLLLLGPPILIISYIFPSLFSIIFGDAWRTSGELAQWMTLWIIGMLTNIPSVRALPVIGRQGMHLLFNSLIMVGGVAGMVTGHLLQGTAMAAVAWYSAITAVLYGVQICTYLFLVLQSDKEHNQ
jgi:O-antigen/teichoic acid export membrane protein